MVLCMFVFILFHLVALFHCKTSVIYLRCMDPRFVLGIARGFCQVPSFPYPNLSYFTSKDITLACQNTAEKRILYNIITQKDDIY